MRRLLVAISIFILILGAGVIWTAKPGTPAAYEAASARITAAIEADARVLRLSDLSALGEIPPNIADIPDLIHLDLSKTLVSDLEPLRNLKKLRNLNLRGTLIKDLEPISNLPALDTLDVGETWISEITPLERLPALRRLDIARTQIKTLEPATRMPALNWINLHGAYALDGSKSSYDALVADGHTVNNGRAFQQDYRPDRLYRTRVWVQRMVRHARLGLGR